MAAVVETIFDSLVLQTVARDRVKTTTLVDVVVIVSHVHDVRNLHLQGNTDGEHTGMDVENLRSTCRLMTASYSWIAGMTFAWMHYCEVGVVHDGSCTVKKPISAFYCY